MRRFIEKKQSSQCQINIGEMTEHFRATWSRPLDEVVEAEENSIFHLEPRITKEDDEEMKEFMLDEKNIVYVIKSRELSASEVNATSY
jgi:hypothetical protein